MSATRIPQQVEGFDTLRELLDIMKNPDQLTKASEIARKEMALTEAEKAKVEEAREFLKNHAKIKGHLEEKQGQLDADRQAHDKHVAEELARIEQEHDVNEHIRRALSDKEQAQKETDARHSAERKQLDAHSAATKKVAADVESQLSKREAALRDKEEKLMARENSLMAQGKKLDDKFAKLKAITSD